MALQGTRVHTHTQTPRRLSPDGAEADCLDLRPRSARGTQGILVNLDKFSAPHLRAVARCPGPTPQSRGAWGQGGPRLGCRGPTLQPHICPMSGAPPPSPLCPTLTGGQPGRILDPEAAQPCPPSPAQPCEASALASDQQEPRRLAGLTDGLAEQTGARCLPKPLLRWQRSSPRGREPSSKSSRARLAAF